jgi:hypothetical protein
MLSIFSPAVSEVHVRYSLPLAIAATCLTVGGVRAAQRCPEQPVFDVEALKSEMMVLAEACHDDAQYNAFIQRYQPSLMANEHALDSYFKREYGRRGQAEHDAYITNLANAQADEGSKLGSDFCPRNVTLFDEAMALDSATELPQFAAGQNLVPASLPSCQAPAAEHEPRRVIKRAAAKRTTGSH